MGELIELRRIRRDRTSRCVVEQDSSRSVVALDGPARSTSPVTSTNGKPRTVCSWKFEIVAKVA